MMKTNLLKRKLEAGNTCYGVFTTICAPELVEIAGIAGFDFVVVDTEHGPASTETVRGQVIAGEMRGITPLVRTKDAESVTILRTLDVGAHGIQVPQVNSREQAENIVSSAKYYPEGTRGMGTPRSGDYGSIPIREYIKAENEETLVIVQCESVLGYENLESIAATSGVDVIFLGPYDMSMSMGMPGEVDSPEINQVREKVLAVAKKNGKYAGTFADTGRRAKELSEMGFRYITIGMDVDHIMGKFQTELEATAELLSLE